MTKQIVVFIWLAIAAGSNSAALAQQGPPAKTTALSAAQNKQLVQGRAVVASFWAAARKGDSQKAQSFCVPNVDTEGLLEPQNRTRMQSWAKSLISTDKGIYRSDGGNPVILFEYRFRGYSGDVLLLYSPLTGKIESIDMGAE